ncbi:NPEPPS [Symbiodinium necroappetens]|uniref:NPEPPS protein n=1 Tax=Symbiodinium necroappetens TaxID=1628268 RepID=A0A813AR56_9DINO|nr:NPEPPS [Symbiodinium necroappetens]
MGRTTSQKKLPKTATNVSIADKKQNDLNFLEEVDGSIDPSSIPRVFQLLGAGLMQGDRACLRAACSAVERICEANEGFFSLLQAFVLKSTELSHGSQEESSSSFRRGVHGAQSSLLTASVLPEEYDLTLEPDLEQFTFDGIVKITCDVHVATDSVSVHAMDLVLSQAVFKPHGSSTVIKADEISTKAKMKTATLGFDEVLPVGKGVLEIKFRGILNDQMAGFYRSQYTDSCGKKRFMATTQFEAIDARRCFPCWDEPARKATFVVTLIYPANLTAISNMPPSRSEVQADGKRRETFMPTPRMSTYLLAFCIGEFEFISASTKGGVLARIFACPGNASRCSFALDCCIRALEFYNDFFGIPYPLPKMDMIAIPDFAAGAMENWGLVTYREVALLCDESTVSATQKQQNCTVIAHELAHQWFGNLVTMEWWEDLWLNEGFANWMQTFASDKLFPDWHIWESYVGTEQQRALQLDALRSSHPIQVPIGHAEEVEEVFDAISYCKGGSVVRMIYSVLGEAHFQEGLRLYFDRHKYGNTVTTDLWNAWKEVSGKPIDKMMSSWTQKMGFPLLEVLNDPLADSTGHVEIRQKWFLADGSSEPSDDDKTWFCPVIVGTDKGSSPAGFLEEKSGKIACASCLPGASMIKVNFGQHVPVRVLYPESVFKRLIQKLSSVPPEDKIGLLSDTFAMSKAGVLDASFLVDLLAGFKSELNDKVWSEISAVLGGLEKVVCQGLADDTAQAFKEFCSKLVVPAFNHVGWETASADSDNRKKLRSTVLAAVSKYCSQDPTISAEAVRRCKDFAASPNDATVLSADIRSAVFDVALQSHHAALAFDELVRAHEVVTDGAVKIHIYGALGKAGGAALQQKALDFCLSGAVRSQDLIYIPMAMATSGKTGADTVFSWMQSEYSRIYDMLGATSMMLFQNMVRVSGAGFVTESKAEEVAAFWKSRDLYKNIEKALAQTVEGIKSNSKFVDRLKGSKAALASTWKSAMANSNLCAKQQMLETNAKGVETMLSFLRHLPQAHVAPNTSEAVNAAAAAMFQRAACWLNDVDEVDFDQLQHVLYLAFWLGAEDEDVALSALDAIERFTLYRSENGATLLQSDVLQVLHRIIGHNRAPELVSEAFTLLYRLCDAPAPAVVPLMTEESGLVRTVVESMLQAPLNMRLQLAGVRLLALWAQFDVAEDPEAEVAMSDQKDLKQFVREANAAEVAKEVAANLTRAGLTHAASWMSAISSRLPKKVQGSKGSKEPREPKASKGSKDEHGPRSASKASGSSRAKSK